MYSKNEINNNNDQFINNNDPHNWWKYHLVFAIENKFRVEEHKNLFFLKEVAYYSEDEYLIF
jgi:hypothetical protein